jgi:hypothetical protein
MSTQSASSSAGTASTIPASFTTDAVEWLRVPDAARRFSLSRSTLYVLMGEGKIKSCCIRRKGAVRGARRISAESVSTYLESLTA